MLGKIRTRNQIRDEEPLFVVYCQGLRIADILDKASDLSEGNGEKLWVIQERLQYGNALHGYIEHGLVIHRESDLSVRNVPMTHISDSIAGENTKGYEIVLLDFVYHSTDAIRRLHPRPKWFVQSHVFSLGPIHILWLPYTLLSIESTS